LPHSVGLRPAHGVTVPVQLTQSHPAMKQSLETLSVLHAGGVPEQPTPASVGPQLQPEALHDDGVVYDTQSRGVPVHANPQVHPNAAHSISVFANAHPVETAASVAASIAASVPPSVCVDGKHSVPDHAHPGTALHAVAPASPASPVNSEHEYDPEQLPGAPQPLATVHC
jgi:hypothetical protein